MTSRLPNLCILPGSLFELQVLLSTCSPGLSTWMFDSVSNLTRPNIDLSHRIRFSPQEMRTSLSMQQLQLKLKGMPDITFPHEIPWPTSPISQSNLAYRMHLLFVCLSISPATSQVLITLISRLSCSIRPNWSSCFHCCPHLVLSFYSVGGINLSKYRSIHFSPGNGSHCLLIAFRIKATYGPISDDLPSSSRYYDPDRLAFGFFELNTSLLSYFWVSYKLSPRLE